MNFSYLLQSRCERRSCHRAIRFVFVYFFSKRRGTDTSLTCSVESTKVNIRPEHYLLLPVYFKVSLTP
jgi:hypothetical protein